MVDSQIAVACRVMFPNGKKENAHPLTKQTGFVEFFFRLLFE